MKTHSEIVLDEMGKKKKEQVSKPKLKMGKKKKRTGIKAQA